VAEPGRTTPPLAPGTLKEGAVEDEDTVENEHVGVTERMERLENEWLLMPNYEPK